MIKILYNITEKIWNWIEQDRWEKPAWILFAILPIFVWLKLLSILTWSWLWVLCPLWIMALFICFVIVIARINVYLYWKLK